MSPRFFATYIHDMIGILRNSGIGCHLMKLFVACILFADDLALMSPSRSGLQRLIEICNDYCNRYCLTFNSKKSKVMIFGKGSDNYNAMPITLNGLALDIVSEWKYLGTTIKSGRSFAFSARPDISSFSRAANSVLNVLTDAHEHVLMNLLYTNCIPILTYACAAKEYSSSDMTDCNTAINSVIRKIFGFEHRQSVRLLREISGFKSIYEIFTIARNKFRRDLKNDHNPVIRFIASIE